MIVISNLIDLKKEEIIQQQYSIKKNKIFKKLKLK